MFSILFTFGAVWSPCADLYSLLGGYHHSGDCCYLGWCFCLPDRGWCWNWGRGIGQSFLVLNRFTEADPALGQGVPCLTGALGMFSEGGGLDWGMSSVLGPGCMAGSLCKLWCGKFIHYHWYSCCGKPSCLHLGGYGSSCWSWCCGCGLVQDSYFIPSLGYHCPSFWSLTFVVGFFVTLGWC